MRKFPLANLILPLVLGIFFSCSTVYQARSLEYSLYQVNSSRGTDSSLWRMLEPYGDSIRASMSQVVGIAEKNLDKGQPESELGNFVVDAFLTMARKQYATQVDIAIMNHGGIRLTQLAAGPVTRGKIFELMPFDNLLILQKLSGSVLQQFLDLAAGRGGWPVAGMTMQIMDGKAVNVRVGGRPLDPSATYTVANSDFIANGGDNADMLRGIPQISNGYLMRDALFDYIAWLKSQGKNISAAIGNRVTNAQ
ncbi:MAG TPA: 5'-nucleotidase C-terminal domain-containing protein [Chitinophagaceae bacterium]|nr:5'-nucleotidase C-terminal domain-containing protein [Chitinophagaceae bacterium]